MRDPTTYPTRAEEAAAERADAVAAQVLAEARRLRAAIIEAVNVALAIGEPHDRLMTPLFRGYTLDDVRSMLADLLPDVGGPRVAEMAVQVAEEDV